MSDTETDSTRTEGCSLLGQTWAMFSLQVFMLNFNFLGEKSLNKQIWAAFACGVNVASACTENPSVCMRLNGVLLELLLEAISVALQSVGWKA